MYKLSAVMLLALLITGCASSPVPAYTTTVTGEVRTALSPTDVMVYTVAPVNYTEIARVSASTLPSLTFNDAPKMGDVVELLKSEAAAVGANAIILSKLDNETIHSESKYYDGRQGAVIKETRYSVNFNALAVYVDGR